VGEVLPSPIFILLWEHLNVWYFLKLPGAVLCIVLGIGKALPVGVIDLVEITSVVVARIP
jgi:hypothetical protein